MSTGPSITLNEYNSFVDTYCGTDKKQKTDSIFGEPYKQEKPAEPAKSKKTWEG